MVVSVGQGTTAVCLQLGRIGGVGVRGMMNWLIAEALCWPWPMSDTVFGGQRCAASLICGSEVCNLLGLVVGYKNVWLARPSCRCG